MKMLLFILIIKCFIYLCLCTRIEYDDGQGNVNRYMTVTDRILDQNVISSNTIGISRVWYTNEREEIKTIKDLPVLRYVKIESVAQQFVPKFRNLPKLDTLYLEHNELNYVSEEHFSTVPLIYVFLRFNTIRSIAEGTFGHNVKHVYLSCNNLTRVHSDWFLNPGRLEVLDLDANNIRYIEENAFKNLTKLDYVYLMHNGMLRIGDGAFAHKSSISEMWLAYNHLTKFSAMIFKDGNVTIELLDISYNRITYLPFKLMDKLHVINTPHIEGNPWQCACYYEYILKWMNWHGYGELTNPDRRDEPRCVVSKGRFRDKCVNMVDKEAVLWFLKNSSPFPEDKGSYCRQKMSIL